MPWVISFIASWVIFLVLIDYKNLKKNIIGGILVLPLASFVDWGGNKLDLYKFYDLIIPWFGCSAFYKFGPIFTMGIVFLQLVPRNKWLQIVHIIVMSLSFLSLEYLIVSTHAAEYIHWHLLASLVVDLLTFSSLTWVATAFLIPNKNKE